MDVSAEAQRESDENFGQLLFGSCKKSPNESNVITAEAKQKLQEKFVELIANSGGMFEDDVARSSRSLAGFAKLFDQFLGDSREVEWNQIEKPSSILQYQHLVSPANAAEIKDMLSTLVVVKLNGGLGTTMGCKGPKSLIEVRDGKSFLGLIVEQIQLLNETYDVNVPLVLMNSFNTDSETAAVLSRYRQMGVDIFTFTQSCYPRICQDTLMPIAPNLKMENKEHWYPPGHGDFYSSFLDSGLLDKFLAQGKTCCFISNADNLGASVDIPILSLIKSGQSDFVMEVTDRQKADVKGGTLIQYQGKVRLLELAQVPKAHISDFKSIQQFQVFNTNNLWISLRAARDLLVDGDLSMEVIVNPKKLDSGKNVYQLEVAMGDAMKCFDRAVGVNVPRSRFLPVKKTSDLLLLMSDLYLMHHGMLVMSPDRVFQTIPAIKLDDEHYKNVKDFLKRFQGTPKMKELDHLTVIGDVMFGKNVTLKGTVIIVTREKIHIPASAVLEDKVVLGNLELLDH